MSRCITQFGIICILCMSCLFGYAWENFKPLTYSKPINDSFVIYDYFRGGLRYKISNYGALVYGLPLLTPYKVERSKDKISYHNIKDLSNLKRICILPGQARGGDCMTLLSPRNRPMNLASMCSINEREDVSLKNIRNMLFALEQKQDKIEVQTVELEPRLIYLDLIDEWVMCENYNWQEVDNPFLHGANIEDLHDLKMECIFTKIFYIKYYKTRNNWVKL